MNFIFKGNKCNRRLSGPWILRMGTSANCFSAKGMTVCRRDNLKIVSLVTLRSWVNRVVCLGIPL